MASGVVALAPSLSSCTWPRRAFAGYGIGIGVVWGEGGQSRKGTKSQDSARLRVSNVRERKSSSNALVLGVALDRRRGHKAGTTATSAQLAKGPPAYHQIWYTWEEFGAHI
jgi:hypothetical protein